MDWWGNVQNQYFMQLTVPVLYYKPIQEPPLKINKGTKKEDGREEKRQERGSWGKGWGGERGPRFQKKVHSCLKAFFFFFFCCFPERS